MADSKIVVPASRYAILATLLVACSPPSAAPQPPPPPSPPAASESGPASASVSAPALAEVPPSARVMNVAPSAESVMYQRAQIVFTNPGKAPCRVLGYALSWGGATKRIKLDNLVVPPGETRERWLRVNPDDGDLKALMPEASRVEIQTDCTQR